MRSNMRSIEMILELILKSIMKSILISKMSFFNLKIFIYTILVIFGVTLQAELITAHTPEVNSQFQSKFSQPQNYFPVQQESFAKANLEEIKISSIKILLSHDSFNYKEYFLIKEDPRLQKTNLLYFNHIKEVFPKPEIPYNRNKHFGSWIIPNAQQSCLSTRGYILKRDSLDEVNFAPNGCSVKQGNWVDPYSAIQFTTSDKIQIDHFVPLKNAYMTGAHDWSWSKRCLYGNYIGNTFHLLAVSGTENMKKSDESPSQYLPPNTKYICTYLKQWLAVKLIWSLKLTPIEAFAIQNEVADNKCNPELFMIPTNFVSEQRQFIQNNMNICRGPTTTLDINDHYDDSEL